MSHEAVLSAQEERSIRRFVSFKNDKAPCPIQRCPVAGIGRDMCHFWCAGWGGGGDNVMRGAEEERGEGGMGVIVRVCVHARMYVMYSRCAMP